jgi:hypothetical protein
MGEDPTTTKSGTELLVHLKEASKFHYCYPFPIISPKSIFAIDATRSNILLLLLRAKHRADSCETK